MPIITLITDFGSDLYVGQIKGVILSINEKAQIIDIKHKVKSYHILEGAFLIWQACPHFPAGTIHLAIIDPGVGTKRGGLIIETENYYFIGPDNGLFSLVLRGQNVKRIMEIDPSKFEKSSSTFQGRDIFAPLAAYISSGKRLEDFGREIGRIKELKLKKNSILYIDEFGNIITNIKESFPSGKELIIYYQGKKVKAKFARTFAEVKRGQFVVLRGSSGFLEVDKNRASAAKSLGAKVGEEIRIYQ